MSFYYYQTATNPLVERVFKGVPKSRKRNRSKAVKCEYKLCVHEELCMKCKQNFLYCYICSYRESKVVRAHAFRG